MRRKSKGLNAERDLIKIFHNHGWAPLRVAGSGSSPIPLPDILAGNGERSIALECKTTKNQSIYIPHDQIEQLIYFAEQFGAEPWVAVRFYRKPWKFYSIKSMLKKGKSYFASHGDDTPGIHFHELIKAKTEAIIENENDKNY